MRQQSILFQSNNNHQSHPAINFTVTLTGIFIPSAPMLQASKLMAFVATTNPEKATAFYGETLGLKNLESTPYAIVFDANGTTIRIQIVETVTPLSYTALGWEVDDIDTTVQNLATKGVSFELFASLPQDKHGIWTSPAGTKVAWFQDTDGNRLSLTQSA